MTDGLTVVGITGGTGTGKTTALGVLANMGALVLDCDAIYHRLAAESGDMRAELIARFGEVYDGSVLNRKKLGARYFPIGRLWRISTPSPTAMWWMRSGVSLRTGL